MNQDPETSVEVPRIPLSKLASFAKWILLAFIGYAILWGDSRWIKRDDVESRLSKIESRVDEQREKMSGVKEEIAAMRASLDQQTYLLRSLASPHGGKNGDK